MSRSKGSRFLFLLPFVVLLSSCSFSSSLTSEEQQIENILGKVSNSLTSKGYKVSPLKDEGTYNCSEIATTEENIIYDSKYYHQYSMRIISSGRPLEQGVTDIAASLDAQGVKTTVKDDPPTAPLTGQKNNMFFYVVVQGELQLTFNLLVTTGCY